MTERLPHSPCRRTDRHGAHEFEVYGRPFWCPGYTPAPPAPPADPAAARERLADMIRTDRGDMNVYSEPEVRTALDTYRDAVQAAAAVVPLPPADQTALRDRIAAVLYERERPPRDPHWAEALPVDREVFEAMADAVLAVLPATTDQTAERYRTAWHSARRRASVLSAELTRRAPLLGEYATEIERLRGALEGERDASRRLLAQRQEMADERYAWQQRGDRAEAEVERLRADRATVLREAADRYAKLADQNEAYDREQGELDETARIQHSTVRDVAIGLRRMADETAATETDTRPAWLHWRFGPHGQPWADVPDEDKALWEHQARAVRRAVARGGFKQPAAGARQDGAQR